MRRWILYSLASGILITAAPSAVEASSTGRRNTAIAATAVAAGAWANGTGSTGRRNTALLATGGAAYTWSKYADKKKDERRRAARTARVQAVCSGKKHYHCKHWVPPGHRRACPPGRAVGHHKQCWHTKHGKPCASGKRIARRDD